MKKLTATLTILALGFAANAIAADGKDDVYTWKKGATNVYSDTPRNLKLDKTNSRVNVRTQTVITLAQKPITPPSLAEQQAELNAKIAAQNKNIEAENARILAEKQKAEQEAKAQNCQLARKNRQFADSARNKDDLIPRYEADIAKYCN